MWLLLAGCGGGVQTLAGDELEGDDAGECTDAEDNDGNGHTDCEDEGCAGSPDCASAWDDLPPSTPLIAISPAAPTADDDLLCEVVEDSVDPEDQDVTLRFAWLRDGSATGLTDAALTADQTTTGDTWTCEVTPNDGTQDGPSGSSTVTIAAGNQAPSAPAVTLHPADPATNQPLQCATLTQAVDPDGDPLEMLYRWEVGGVDAGLDTEIIAKSETAEGETWTCFAAATDGQLTSAEASASATIGQRAYTDDITGLGGTTYSASSCFGGCDSSSYHAPNAFDDNHGTSGYSTWHATWTGGPEWIAVDFGEGNAYAVTRYGLMGASFHEGYRVRDFELQGSDDGETWTTVDRVEDANLAFVMYGGEAMSFWEVEHESAYQHWRYLITENEGGQTFADEVGIVEIEMFGDAEVQPWD